MDNGVYFEEGAEVNAGEIAAGRIALSNSKYFRPGAKNTLIVVDLVRWDSGIAVSNGLDVG
jgi:hypothetical protein